MYKLVTDYLDEAAMLYPNKIAFLDTDRSVTFAELRKEAILLSKIITEKIRQRHMDESHINTGGGGVGNLAQIPVAIYMKDSVETVISMFGVSYSGHFYSVINIENTSEQFNKTLDILRPKLMITKRSQISRIMETMEDVETEMILFEDIDNQLEYMNNGIYFTSYVDGSVTDYRYREVIGSDLLYVMFTSGTTGEPKGVIVSQSTAVAATESYNGFVNVNSKDAFLNAFSFSASASVDNTFYSVREKIKNYIMPCHNATDVLFGVRELNTMQITHLVCPAAFMRLAMEYDALKKQKCKFLKFITYGGEGVSIDALSYWSHHIDNVQIYNGYGATEVIGGAIYHLFSPNEDTKYIPIGKPASKIIAVIYESKYGLITTKDVGHSGELYIGGDTVANGYLRNEKLTAEKFVQNPLHNDYRDIYFRTGDIVCYNDQGELVYVGRKDNQIKHHGYRIELEEVERVVGTIKGINECGCVYDTDREQLILFFAGEADEMAVHREAHDILPQYMVPSKFIHLDEMPHNSNGKINRKKLARKLEPK